MRRLIRTALALGMLGAIATLTAATVAAGNYAETSIIDGGGDGPPTAGEERELRLMLLQHGVTPVDHGGVELSAWLPGTDERISVIATSVGRGEWVATVTFPTAGEWQMRILHSVFDTPPPTAITVGPSPSAAWLPATGSITAMLLVAVALIAVARMIGGARVASEPAGEALRAG